MNSNHLTEHEYKLFHRNWLYNIGLQETWNILYTIEYCRNDK